MRLNEADMEKILGKMQGKSNTPIPACGYCRFSSDLQREESIEAQQRIITEYAEKNGYEIIEWYIDRAYSGKTVNRPDFQRLLNDISSNDCRFKTVIVHKMDRFSRNAAQALEYKGVLQDYGIELVSTAEQIKDDANGKLLYGIMATINQYYIDNLSNEVLKGLKENALKSYYNGGKPCLGYKIVDKKYVIEESEAVIVKKIFQMAADGYGYNTIIKELNARGYKTKAGNNFGKNSLYDLIQNERYKGVYIFNKRVKRNSQNKRNNRKYKDPSEIIRIENGCPPIVSKELWDRANAARKMTARLSTNAKNNYLLSGLVYCGECGSKMHGNPRKKGANGYCTYRCNCQATKLNCSCKEIRTDVLEEFVISNLTEHFFNPEVIDIITDEINIKLRESLNSEKEEIRKLKSSLSGLRLTRNNIVDAIAKSGFNQALSEKLDSTEKQIAEYESMIRKDEEQKSEITITREEVKEKIDCLKQHMLNPANVEQTKFVLQQYIDRITVDNNSVKVTFKVTLFYCLDGKQQEISYTYFISERRKYLEKMRKTYVDELPKTLDHRNFVTVYTEA